MKKETTMRKWAVQVRLPDEWKEEACWEWTGVKSHHGYGQMQYREMGRSAYRAHRYSYERFIGPVPAGLVLDHLCRNTGCVNPMHLEAVTQRENVLRGTGYSAQNAVKQFCQKGHEFTPENTYQKPNDGGRRNCRACRKVYQRKWKDAQKATQAEEATDGK